MSDANINNKPMHLCYKTIGKEFGTQIWNKVQCVCMSFYDFPIKHYNCSINPKTSSFVACSFAKPSTAQGNMILQNYRIVNKCLGCVGPPKIEKGKTWPGYELMSLWGIPLSSHYTFFLFVKRGFIILNPSKSIFLFLKLTLFAAMGSKRTNRP